MTDFQLAHFGDLGDLIAVFIEQGDVEEEFEVFVLIVADIGRGPVGVDDAVALFPNPDGMGLDARELFQIFYGINRQGVQNWLGGNSNHPQRFRKKCKFPDEIVKERVTCCKVEVK